jgi:hypothetical protein
MPNAPAPLLRFHTLVLQEDGKAGADEDPDRFALRYSVRPRRQVSSGSPAGRRCVHNSWLVGSCHCGQQLWCHPQLSSHPGVTPWYCLGYCRSSSSTQWMESRGAASSRRAAGCPAASGGTGMAGRAAGSALMMMRQRCAALCPALCPTVPDLRRCLLMDPPNF